MQPIQVNFQNVIGRIKPMHAVGQPPFGGGFLSFDFSHMRHLQNAHVPYARLHDVDGLYGGFRFVDIPNLFRDFDADETLPESYDFAFTDELLRAMAEYDLKPVFRLGVTIENQMNIKAYRIHPPKDFEKWARICEHVIRHYNEGWADGFYYGIEYWEIWNEPENGETPRNNQMWTGTAEQYFELYDVTAKHLKACFGDTIRVGGYGSCGFGGIFYDPEKYSVEGPRREVDERMPKYMFRIEFLYGFLEYIKAHHSPIDFFSWHSYSDVKKTRQMARFLDRVLTQYGYGDLETHLNEWNNAFGNENHGTSYASAAVAAMMCAMQNEKTEMLCYYDARLQASAYGGLFAPLTYEPVCTYYSLYAFGELYALGTQVECSCTEEGIYAIAATDGEKKAILIVNANADAEELSLPISGEWQATLIDHEHLGTTVKMDPASFRLEGNQVVLWRAER